MRRHLAQLNIGTLRHPIDDPRTAGFADALPLVNGAGEQSPGYVWRLQSDSGNATDIQVFEDPMVIVNLTVWESVEALKAFAYRGVHRDFFRRRAEWFVPGSSRTALWWVPAGALPSTDDAKQRLDFIDAFGVSPFAFAMGQEHPALVVAPADPDDDRARALFAGLHDGFGVDHGDVADGRGALVIAELDDVAVAFGVYQLIDDGTAQITRMHVAQTARGLRIGAAIVAGLERAARAGGARRLLLETGPRQRESLDKYEQFGFRRCPCRPERDVMDETICVEKSLAGEPGRLA